MDVLSLDQIKRQAPSVFAEAPYEKVSDKYRFVPTSEVLSGMIEQGFKPVYAAQTKANKSERLHTNRHVLRFRHDDLLFGKEVGDSIPEIVLFNSHNGSCSYRLMFGVFRLVCENGMVVQSATVDEVKVRHIGSVVDNVIDASFELINEAPKITQQVQQWQDINLDRRQQKRLADLSASVRPTEVKFDTECLLQARRTADDVLEGGDRSLWKTMNVIQENLIRGGFIYEDENANTRTMRQVKAVHASEIINRRLWEVTEGFANRLRV